MQIAIPRYSIKPFPAYRYVPSQGPHPVLHPEGHSYQKTEEKLHYQAPEQWMLNESYLFGVDLFNHGFWWEAHEAWENVWLTTEKDNLEGQFLQGMIQFSAALLKLYGGSRQGFENLYREARKRLDFCLLQLRPQHRTHFMGLNLLAWLNKMEQFREIILHQGETHCDALQFVSFPAMLLDK